MTTKKTKTTGSKVWSIAKPVLTLGLSLLIGGLSKKTGKFEEVTNVVGNEVVNQVIDSVDNVIQESDNDVKKVQKKR